MAFQNKIGLIGASQSGPMGADSNVIPFSAAQRGSSDDGPVEAKPKPPTIEDRYATSALKVQRYVLGRQAQGEEPDTTLYSWVNDGQGARWQRQVEKVVRGQACAWLRSNSRSNVSGSKVSSCIQILRDVLIHERKTLPQVPAAVDVVPLRNAYLLIEIDGERKGRIRAVRPDPSYGQTYAIQADIDWDRVHDDGTYVPLAPKQGSYCGRYLNSTFSDAAVYDLAQEAFSMALLSRCYEKAVWMYGTGENGKSCMLHILRSLAPAATAAINLARLAKNEFGTNQLIAKKIAICAEMPKLLTSDIQEVLKGLISRDPTPAEFKGCDSFTFVPEVVIYGASNHHAVFPDHEHGWHRKVLTIPFLNRLAKEDKIQGLNEKITDDPAEMIQLIDWLLIGAIRLTRRGRFMSDDEMPVVVRELASTQRLISDPVAAWIDDAEPVVDMGAQTEKNAIYKDFQQHAIDAGRKPIAENAFWLRVGEHFRAEGLDTSGKQIPIGVAGKRPRHVNLLVPGIKPTTHVVVLSAAELAKAAANPPPIHKGDGIPDYPRKHS